jgi:hypothetical protein
MHQRDVLIALAFCREGQLKEARDDLRLVAVDGDAHHPVLDRVLAPPSTWLPGTIALPSLAGLGGIEVT